MKNSHHITIIFPKKVEHRHLQPSQMATAMVQEVLRYQGLSTSGQCTTLRIYMRNLPAIQKQLFFLLLKLYNVFPFGAFGNSQWIELYLWLKKTTQLPSNVCKLPSFHLSLLLSVSDFEVAIALAICLEHHFLDEHFALEAPFVWFPTSDLGDMGMAWSWKDLCTPDLSYCLPKLRTSNSWLAPGDRILKACGVSYD